MQSYNLAIRPALPNDIGAIQQIAYRTWPIAYGDILSEQQISYMLRLLYSKEALGNQMQNQHFFLALYNFQAAGFAAFSLKRHGVYKLEKLYVLPDFQKLAIGQKLLQKVEETVRSLKGTLLQLNVNRQNKARYFYERQGFTIAYTEDIDIGEGYFMNDYVMEKPLQT